jgi:hypothetical protein
MSFLFDEMQLKQVGFSNYTTNMKRKLLILLTLLGIILYAHAQSLGDGYYKVRFSNTIYKPYTLKISGDRFIKYYSATDSFSGNLNRVGENNIYFYINDCDTINVKGPLRDIYRSWGLPIVAELDRKISSKKRLYFRTTFERNYHVTVNTGYFERLIKNAEK